MQALDSGVGISSSGTEGTTKRVCPANPLRIPVTFEDFWSDLASMIERLQLIGRSLGIGNDGVIQAETNKVSLNGCGNDCSAQMRVKSDQSRDCAVL